MLLNKSIHIASDKINKITIDFVISFTIDCANKCIIFHISDIGHNIIPKIFAFGIARFKILYSIKAITHIVKITVNQRPCS